MYVYETIITSVDTFVISIVDLMTFLWRQPSADCFFVQGFGIDKQFFFRISLR